ncbi:hypothetical protein [Ammoniphilus sp. CFH 90114]|uniref:hypothetical protein n=1 Tax=Ammoniphilus sp. CFH 90114 TaxID=2493665 RepID=UPI00100F2823|nr:hypothetical protein [Ammoniphilus sp. CFH 90114]RXT06373.1 hypothetical protein EIZ39_14975 [Ammoniphilus sp. CFH 90114]
MQVLNYIPVPLVFIEPDWNIVAYSSEVAVQFSLSSSLLDWTDEESKRKLQRLIVPKSTQKIELNLIHKDGTLHLYDIYQKWQEDRYGYLILMEKEQSSQRLSFQLQQLRQQLLAPPEQRKQPEIGKPVDPQIEELASKLQWMEDLFLQIQPDLLEDRKAHFISQIFLHLKDAKTIIKNLEVKNKSQ